MKFEQASKEKLPGSLLFFYLIWLVNLLNFLLRSRQHAVENLRDRRKAKQKIWKKVMVSSRSYFQRSYKQVNSVSLDFIPLAHFPLSTFNLLSVPSFLWSVLWITFLKSFMYTVWEQGLYILKNLSKMVGLFTFIKFLPVPKMVIHDHSSGKNKSIYSFLKIARWSPASLTINKL